MKKFLILILAVAVGTAGISMEAKTKRKAKKRTAKRTIVQPEPTGFEYVEGSDSLVDVVDMPKYPPEYPGGTEGLIKFLSENIKYPKSAEKKGIHGIVVLQFIVEKTGKISNIKVLKSVNKALDNEAVRVCKKIKHFIPGYNEDHAPVRVLYTLPVNFVLK